MGIGKAAAVTGTVAAVPVGIGTAIVEKGKSDRQKRTAATIGRSRDR